MYIHVTCKAVREFLEHHFPVRLSVAFLALRHISVLGVAGCTSDLSVFAQACGQFAVYSAVASAAYFVGDCLRIGNDERGVDRMACETRLVLSL